MKSQRKRDDGNQGGFGRNLVSEAGSTATNNKVGRVGMWRNMTYEETAYYVLGGGKTRPCQAGGGL